MNIDELDLDNLEERISLAKDKDNCVVSIINTTPKIIDTIEDLCPDYRAFHIVRDPRELLISCYFDHRDSHPTSCSIWHWPELELTKQRLNELSEVDGVLFEMQHIFDKIMQVQYNALLPKLDPQKVMTMKIEDFIKTPLESLQAIMRFLNVDTTNSDLEKIINNGRRHKTKSKPGGWEDVATPIVEELFYSRYKQILTNFGYPNGSYIE